MIRICPKRDARCPHGRTCRYADGYNCTEPARPSPTGEKVEAEPAAWEAYWPGAGSINSETALTNRKAKADEWEDGGAEVTPLYYAATIAALVAERDEAREKATKCQTEFVDFCEAHKKTSDALATANARVERYREALDEIVNPIAAMQRRADAAGGRIDGMMANQIAKDAYYLRGIAAAALTGGEDG